jgi:hypothetical protein
MLTSAWWDGGGRLESWIQRPPLLPDAEAHTMSHGHRKRAFPTVPAGTCTSGQGAVAATQAFNAIQGLLHLRP